MNTSQSNGMGMDMRQPTQVYQQPPMEEQQMIQQPAPSHKARTATILIVLLLIVAGAGYWWKSQRQDITTEVKAVAEPGKLVSEMPQEYIVTNDATITDSKNYQVTAKTGQVSQVSTVSFTTRSTPPTVLKAYIDVMKKNGFSIEESKVMDSKARIIGTRRLDGFSAVVVGIENMGDNNTIVNIYLNKTL